MASSTQHKLLEIQKRYQVVQQEWEQLTQIYGEKWGQLQQDARNPNLSLDQKLSLDEKLIAVEARYRPRVEELQIELQQLQLRFSQLQMQQLLGPVFPIVSDSSGHQQQENAAEFELSKSEGQENVAEFVPSESESQESTTDLILPKNRRRKRERKKKKNDNCEQSMISDSAESQQVLAAEEFILSKNKSRKNSAELIRYKNEGKERDKKKKKNDNSELSLSPSVSRMDSEEFPSLGAQGPISKKEQKKIIKEETQKGRHLSGEMLQKRTLVSLPDNSGLPVPAPSQPEQSPGQKLTATGPQWKGSPKNMRRPSGTQRYSKEMINEVGLNYIISTSEQQKLVTAEDTEKYILERFNVSHVRELGLRYQSDISCIKKLIENQTKINAYFYAYSLVNAIGTAHDLGERIPLLFEKTSFTDLHLGPYVKQPKLRELFGIPPGVSTVPAITTYDVLNHLKAYMDQKKMWMTRVNLVQFLTYLQEQYGCESMEQLGVRVKSVGLAISVIKSAQKHQKNWTTEARERLKNEVIEQTDKKLQKLKRQLQESILTEDERNTTKKRRYFAEKDAVDVVVDVFTKCQKIYSANFMDPDHVVMPFLTLMLRDEFARKLFQLCLCTAGDLEIPKVADDMQHSEEDQRPNTEEVKASGPPKPTEAALLEQLRQTVSQCSSTMTLRVLASLEKRLTQQNGFQEFHTMGHGSFTEFLGHHVKELEDVGIVNIGGTGAAGGFTPTRDVVFQFVRQTLTLDLPSDAIGQMMCDHFKVKKATELGCGTIANMLAVVKDDGQRSAVFYEAASVRSHSSAPYNHTVEEAIECLTSAPLLTDLSSWSLWEVIFQPNLGPLKAFVEKYGKDCAVNGEKKFNDLYCLETSPSVLLRVTMETSEDCFKAALDGGDTQDISGHLVSIFLRDGGLKNAPLALLANHVTTALHSMAEKGVIGSVPVQHGDAETTEDRQAGFILRCLTKIPARICKAVARQVFLEPLGKTVSKTKAYQLLLQASKSIEENLCLESLGLALGISEWTESLWGRLRSCSADTLDDAQDFSDQDSDDDIKETEDLRERKKEVTVTKTAADSVINKQDEAEDKERPRTSLDDNDDLTNTHESIKTEQNVSPENVEQASSEREAQCFNVIQNIRQEKFGIGLVLDEEGRKLAHGLKELVGRSLDKLSQELYNKDTHFVLELIQNADDNAYPGVQGSDAQGLCDQGSAGCPELVFVVDKDCISLYNNETGFSEKNIRAICDVGMSTKGKHKQGYIGQKGIGFKSVFTVTNTPEIHSNGFCLRFDANSGPTGYILPHWVSESERIKPEINKFKVSLTTGRKSKKKTKRQVDLTDERWNTKISLPLKTQTEQEKYKSRSLTSSFQDVHPSLLLFLHRLKRLTVINKVTGEIQAMQRTDLGNDVIEIQSSVKTEKWLLFKKSFPVPEQLNPDVESTELALAFPLLQREGSPTGDLPKQDVFAFLPLRCFGFKFVVQGDFEIPASRQDISQDSRWNQWLREQLPKMFVDSLTCFQNHPDFSEIDAVVAFLRHVPVEGELFDFFQPVAKQILQLLQGRACLPVQGEKGLNWKTPAEIMVSKHKETSEVITQDILQKYLGKYYLDPGVQKTVSSMLLKSLGVHTMEARDVVEVLKGSLKDQCTTSGKGLTIQKCAQWLVCIFHYLEKAAADEHHIAMETVKSLPIIPLADGSFVALTENNVFFSAGKKSGATHSTPMQAALRVLEQDIPTVHPDVLKSLDDVQNPVVKRMLENLGVKHITPSEVIQKHVLPCLNTTGTWKVKPPAVLLAYVQLIMEQWVIDKHSLNLEDIRKVIQLQLTNGHFVNPLQTPVQFSEEYLSRFDLRKMFPDCEWNIVSVNYLRLSDTGLNKTVSQQWRMFLEAMGVKEFLSVDKKEVVLKHNELDSSPWASYKDLFPDYEGRYYIQDNSCPQFDCLVSGQLVSQRDTPPTSTSKFQQMSSLLRALDELWNGQYSRFKVARVLDENKRELKQVDSSFVMNVKKLPWIPCEKGKFCSGGGATYSVEMENLLLHGKDVYVRDRKIEKILGEHVPYLARDIGLKSSLIQELGIKTTLTIKEITKHLDSWSATRSWGGEFATTVKHMKNVYKHFELLYEEEIDHLKDIFRKNDYIFVPNIDVDVTTYGADLFVSGEFLPLKSVCWQDPTGLIQKYGSNERGTGLSEKKEGYRQELVHHYPDMEHFFRSTLDIMETPTMKEYALLLEQVADGSPVPNHTSTTDAYKIFEMLGQKCLKKTNFPADHTQNALLFPVPPEVVKEDYDVALSGHLKTLLDNKDVIPTTSNKWVQLNEGPLLADDQRLADLFKRQMEDKVLLVAEPFEAGFQQLHDEKEETKWSDRAGPFFHAVGISHLSKCVEKEVITESTSQSPEVQDYVHMVVPFIQQFLFSQHRYQYKHLKEDKKVCGILSLLRFYQSGKLDVVYRFRDKPEVMVTVQEKCILQNDEKFYVQKDSLKSHHDIDKELVKIFLPPAAQEWETRLMNFLMALRIHLQKQDGRTDEEFQRDQMIKALPEEEEKWKVPKPVISLASPITATKQHNFHDLNWTEKDEEARKKKIPTETGEVTSWPPPPPKERMCLTPDSERTAGMNSGEATPLFSPSSSSHVRLGDPLTTERTRNHRNNQEMVHDPSAPQVLPPCRQNEGADGEGRVVPSGEGQRIYVTEDSAATSQDEKTRLGSWEKYRENETQFENSPAERDGKVLQDSSMPYSQVNALPQNGNVQRMLSNEAEASFVPYPQVEHSQPRQGDHSEHHGTSLGNRGPFSSSFFSTSVPLGPAMYGPGDSIERVKFEDINIEMDFSLPAVTETQARDKRHVGDWGEKWVNSYLKAKYSEQIHDNHLVVHWANEKQESGRPYDFCIEFAGENKGCIYIEVKSTFSENKDMFEISSQEIQAAQKLKQCYQIYRVYNAGNISSPVKLRVLENVSQLLEAKAIKMSMWL